MVFGYDAEFNLRGAVSLINTAGDPDLLANVGQLDTWYREFAFTGRRDRNRAELDAVRALRPVLRSLLLSERDAAAEAVNRLLAGAQAVPQLRRHDGLDWHIHAVARDAPLAERITVEVAVAMIDVIRADELSRLAVCADERCDNLVLDLSRNRSRRYCSTNCANRNASAAYRHRQRHDDPKTSA